MKVCIDIRPTLKPTSTGLGKLTIVLIEGLIDNLPDSELILYYERRPFDFKKKVPRFKKSNITYVNGCKNKDIDADLFLTSCYDFDPPKDAKYILIIPDLIPLAASEFSSQDAKDRLLNLLPKRLNRADGVICISESTKTDLEKFYPSVKDKTRVIYLAVDKSFKKINNETKIKARLKKLGIDDDYILFVSAIEPRKNLISLLRAFSFIKSDFPHLKLVIAGKKVKSYNEFEEFMKKCEFEEDIKYLGYARQEDIIYLYNGAQIFIYPSFYEGFGLPIVEAFSCGVPVITSNISSMKEVAKDAAVLVDPYSPKDIAKAIKKVLTDRDYKRELIDKGLKKAEEYSIQRMAEEYISLFTGYSC